MPAPAFEAVLLPLSPNDIGQPNETIKQELSHTSRRRRLPAQR